jgi:2-keto-4-pentenoate hydratase/2-oxohepta-3-ene-1,7-dioic acid hydratase in catechol pathway
VRLARVRADGRDWLARIDEGGGRVLAPPPDAGLPGLAALPALPRSLERPLDGGAGATLLAPCRPTKVVAIGRNYAAHARELGNDVPSRPLVFLKPPSAVVGPGEPILLPGDSERVEHEGELGAVIGRRCRHVAREDALAVVGGWVAVNDVTARDLQKADVQFTRAKSFDTFCPVGPWLETDLDIRDALVLCRVNEQVRQSGRTSQMIFDVSTLISAISRIMTLEEGDLISTGTPEGVGPLREGDRVEVEISGIGVLRNPVGRDRTGPP